VSSIDDDYNSHHCSVAHHLCAAWNRSREPWVIGVQARRSTAYQGVLFGFGLRRRFVVSRGALPQALRRRILGWSVCESHKPTGYPIGGHI
jgi:hypothetical protein